MVKLEVEVELELEVGVGVDAEAGTHLALEFEELFMQVERDAELL